MVEFTVTKKKKKNLLRYKILYPLKTDSTDFRLILVKH